MDINGLQRLTLLDYPGRLAATVFLGGCNFRCPFCHNASLVTHIEGDIITESDFFSFLDSRRGKLTGVCVTGGEPTLRRDLPYFMSAIKSRGFSVKLDTNGSNPEMLRSLISDRLVDYVAMDIKNSKERYAETSGAFDIDLARVCESVELLLSGVVEYEFRTTVVRELHTVNDIIAIGKWINGARAYFLQYFKDSGDLIQGGFSGYSEAEMKMFLQAIFSYVPNAQIRG